MQYHYNSVFTNTYNIEDFHPYDITYYRLTIFNLDETFLYSSIVGVKLNSNGQSSTLEYINILGEHVPESTRSELQTRINQYIIRFR